MAEEEQKYWCGPKDGLIRSRVYHFLEQHWLQSILVILLLLDVLITMGELLAGWKVIPVDSAHGWQYLENNGMPREYLCAVGSDNMESCCRETLSLYNTKRSQPPFENVAECLLLTKNISAGHNTHGLHGSSPSTASHVGGGHVDHGGGHDRMLSASEHGDEPFSFQESTCYAPSHNFVRHHDHGTLETTLHWIGVSIIVVFLTELTLLIYVFGPTQFFCSFYPVFREGDLVRIVRHGNTTKRFVVAELAKISHVNPATGQCDVVVLKNPKTGRLKMIGALYDQAVHHVEMLEMSTSSGPRRFWQGWYHKGYVLDFVVVLVSFITEIGVDGSAVTLFIILRLWRIIRVFHGLYEGKHKLGREMHEMQEEFSDVKLNHQILLTDIFRYDNGQKSAEEVVEKVKAKFLKPSTVKSSTTLSWLVTGHQKSAKRPRSWKGRAVKVVVVEGGRSAQHEPREQVKDYLPTISPMMSQTIAFTLAFASCLDETASSVSSSYISSNYRPPSLLQRLLEHAPRASRHAWQRRASFLQPQPPSPSVCASSADLCALN